MEPGCCLGWPGGEAPFIICGVISVGGHFSSLPSGRRASLARSFVPLVSAPFTSESSSSSSFSRSFQVRQLSPSLARDASQWWLRCVRAWCGGLSGLVGLTPGAGGRRCPNSVVGPVPLRATRRMISYNSNSSVTIAHDLLSRPAEDDGARVRPGPGRAHTRNGSRLFSNEIFPH